LKSKGWEAELEAMSEVMSAMVVDAEVGADDCGRHGGLRIHWEKSFAKDVDETETRMNEFVEATVEWRESEKKKEQETSGN
jgi:hypothetical protein